MGEAREALERLIGGSSDWARLDEYLVSYVVEPSLAATVFASSFASSLELVREGLMELHQQAAFAPIYVRKRRQTIEGTAELSDGEKLGRGDAVIAYGPERIVVRAAAATELILIDVPSEYTPVGAWAR